MRILVIWFGTNDACIKPSIKHVPLPKFIENIKHMVNLVRSPESPYHSPSTRVLLITPPPVDTRQRAVVLGRQDPPLPLDRAFEVTQAYAEGVKEAAAACKVSVVDVWSAIWKAAGEREEALNEFLSDGLHLTLDGYTVSVVGYEHRVS
jgi:lysophospholipase L1-like esterase